VNDEPVAPETGSDPHFGIVATIVVAALVMLFVWQPWSGAPPPDRPIVVETPAAGVSSSAR